MSTPKWAAARRMFSKASARSASVTSWTWSNRLRAVRTARPWSTAGLAAARHTCDLRPDVRIHLHVDAAHHGLGSASCGPPVPAWHTLAAVPASFTVGLAGAGPGAGTTLRSASIKR